MSEFAPPTGPPPPKVPEGWKAIWNDQYSEWFFVNIYTKKSQWEKPTEPVYPPGEGPADHPPPPSYAPPPSGASPRTSTDKRPLSSNNPYTGAKPDISEDERLARQLQEEEDARAREHAGDNRGAADAFYQGGAPPNQYAGYGQQGVSPYPQAQSPYEQPVTQEKGKSKGGFLGKLLAKASHHGSSSHQQHGPQQQGYPQQYGQQGYGAPPGGYYGSHQQQHVPYPPQQMHGRPGRMGGGMGAGGLALGAGAGLLGGAVVGSALADAGDGGDYGGDGGDFGGDGGDFGGDGGGDGGGDFGGGDFGGGGDF